MSFSQDQIITTFVQLEKFISYMHEYLICACSLKVNLDKISTIEKQSFKAIPTKSRDALQNSSRKLETSRSQHSLNFQSQNDFRADVLNGTVWLDAVPADSDFR